ncbi:FAD-binding protein [Salmonella enterica subsp. enterica]|nr:FAD-binding protein [Salmonella enterica subsp. enterica]
MVSVDAASAAKRISRWPKRCAALIGAELACSRPVAENEKWMEHERYVGISNLMLKPELYLAVGIPASGIYVMPTARRRFSPSTKIKTRQSSSMRICYQAR